MLSRRPRWITFAIGTCASWTAGRARRIGVCKRRYGARLAAGGSFAVFCSTIAVAAGGCSSGTSAPSDSGEGGTLSEGGPPGATRGDGGAADTGAVTIDGSGNAVGDSASNADTGPTSAGNDGAARDAVGDSEETTDGSGEAAADSGDAGGTTSGSGVNEWYEAEAIPPNQIFEYAMKTTCAPICPKPVVPGAVCCSGGGEVTWIVSENAYHTAGWMVFNDIAAPADGTYDLTFWYHSGGGDTYGDNNCGGQPLTQPDQVGCRPQTFVINGTTMPGAYHFPTYKSGAFIIRAATVSLPLAKGMNTIKVAPPPPRDSVDMDALQVLPSGMGIAPRIAPDTTDLIGN